jgi:Ca-activated chloride channel family protein
VAFPPPTSQRSPRRALPIILAAVVGVVAIVATYLILRPDSDDGPDPGTVAGRTARGECTTLQVSASSEKAALLKRLAGEYAKTKRSFAGGKCAAVTVTSAASGASTDALSRGWNTERDGGPVPDVWTPASSSWVRLLEHRLTSADKPALVPTGTLQSVARTPLVLAMPKPMAQALGWPDKQIGWTDLLGLARDPRGWGAKNHPEWGAFKLGKTNPHFSTSGLNATIGTYYAATGRSSDLAAADLTDPQVLKFVTGVESSVVHYGDTTLTFLSNLAEADARGEGLSYISAVAVEEKSVWDYNQGNPTGDPAMDGKGKRPKTPLVAVYPKEGTLLSDNPYVVLTTASAAKKAAAADFLAYLRSPGPQKEFGARAFRNFDGTPGSAVTTGNGMLPQAKFTTISPPAPAVLDGVEKSWDSLRKRARVLLVLDTSGSMSESVKGGGSRLELAQKAARQAVTEFAPNDEVGLWTFSTGKTLADVPWVEQVPVGPLSSTGATIRKKIDGLSPQGGTALYRTTRDARSKLLDTYDPTRINAVVLLTDGQNEYPPDNDLDGLTKTLGSGDEFSVRVFPIAYGDSADLDSLKKIASASEAVAYDARDPASIEKVFTAVVSNF